MEMTDDAEPTITNPMTQSSTTSKRSSVETDTRRLPTRIPSPSARAAAPLTVVQQPPSCPRSPGGAAGRCGAPSGRCCALTSCDPLLLGAGAPHSPVRHPMHVVSLPHRASEVADRVAARPGAGDEDGDGHKLGAHVNFATVR